MPQTPTKGFGWRDAVLMVATLAIAAILGVIYWRGIEPERNIIFGDLSRLHRASTNNPPSQPQHVANQTNSATNIATANPTNSGSEQTPSLPASGNRLENESSFPANNPGNLSQPQITSPQGTAASVPSRPFAPGSVNQSSVSPAVTMPAGGSPLPTTRAYVHASPPPAPFLPVPDTAPLDTEAKLHTSDLLSLTNTNSTKGRTNSDRKTSDLLGLPAHQP